MLKIEIEAAIVAAATTAVVDNRKRSNNINTDDDIWDDLKAKRSRLFERLVVLRRFCAG